MKYQLVMGLWFISSIAGKLFGQTMPYLIEGAPTIFREVENHLQQDELDAAFSRCSTIIAKEHAPKTKGIAYFYQGEAAALLGSMQLADVSFMNAIELFKTINFQKGLAMAYAKQGDLYFFQRDFLMADSLYGQSIERCEKLALNEVLADVYQNKAMIYTEFQDAEAAMLFLKKALSVVPQMDNQDRTKSLLNQISTTYHATGELDSALVYFQKGIDTKNKTSDNEGLISDYSAMGNLYRQRGSYELAQQQLLKGLKIAEAEQDTFAMMSLFSEIGDVYAAQEGWQKAEEYYNIALQQARDKKRRFVEAGCLSKLGRLNQLQAKEAEAITQYEAALQIYEELNSKINAAEVQISLSKLYKDGNQIQKAKASLLEALSVRNQFADKLSILTVKMALADIELMAGDRRQGISLVKECLAEYEEMEDLEGMKQGYLMLSEAYSKSNNFELAFQFFKRYNSVSERLTSIERTKAVNELGMLYATEKKDKEIAQQKISIEQQRAAITKRNNQMILLAGGLVVAGLLLSLLLYVNRKNKQLNQKQIEVLKKEQETQRLRSVIEGEEKERKRLAQELHDGLGAVLATVKMQISSIQHKLPEVQNLPTYIKAESLIDDACRTVREVSHGLMPLVIEQQGLEYAIADMCQTLVANKDIEIHFIPHGTDHLLEDTVQTTIYRIVQELLKNILKHAAAKEVIVQLTIEDDQLQLIVEDDGKGFNVAVASSGIGLENIRSRTAYLGGTLDIDSLINEGTTFTINLPLTAD